MPREYGEACFFKDSRLLIKRVSLISSLLISLEALGLFLFKYLAEIMFEMCRALTQRQRP